MRVCTTHILAVTAALQQGDRAARHPQVSLRARKLRLRYPSLSAGGNACRRFGSPARRQTRRPADVSSCRATTTMHSTRDAGVAGFMIVSTAVLCAAVGAGVRGLIGAPPGLAVGGGFLGFRLGVRLVYASLKDV